MLALFKRHVRLTLCPIILMLTTPIIIVMLRHYVVHCQQIECISYKEIYEPEKLFDLVLSSFASLKWDATATLQVMIFFAYAAASTLLLGGKQYHGPRTEQGFVPTYYANGFRYYLLTTSLTLLFLNSGHTSAWQLLVRLDYYQSALLAFGFLFCAFLFVKGHMFVSEGDHSISGNIIFDFYWGIELYPRIGSRLDVKQIVNSRFGMMLWQILVLICAVAHFEKYGFSYAMSATTVLQSIYICKFFYWEEGYMQSIDIIVDRAGYYICWGCICFVPFFYAIPSLALVGRTPPMSFVTASVIVTLGTLWIFLNYWCDYQRQVCRRTNGNCNIWFRPANVIHATYVDSEGQEQQSLLLASGFWRFSRHCNYVFEILAALFWTLPAGLAIVPYMYTIFLTILLLHRCYRDEEKCSKKYGQYWDEYCQYAKYKMIFSIW